jgi:hypothetical protein
MTLLRGGLFGEEDVMNNTLSLVEYDGQWHEDRICGQPIISNNKYSIEMEDQDGPFNLNFQLEVGEIFRGEYKYEGKENLPGKVVFERYESSRGDVFVGRWTDNSSNGRWIVHTCE